MRTPDTAAGYSREWPASVRSWNGMNSDGNIDIGPRCWCWCPFLELQEFYYRLPWRLNAPTMTTKFRDMQHCCTMCFKTVFWSVYCIFRFIWEIYKLAGMTHNAGVSPWKRPGVIWGRCELMWTLRFGELKDSVARCMFIRDWGLFPKPDPMAIAVMGKTCQHSHHRDRITCTYFDLLNWTNEIKWIQMNRTSFVTFACKINTSWKKDLFHLSYREFRTRRCDCLGLWEIVSKAVTRIPGRCRCTGEMFRSGWE